MHGTQGPQDEADSDELEGIAADLGAKKASNFLTLRSETSRDPVVLARQADRAVTGLRSPSGPLGRQGLAKRVEAEAEEADSSNLSR